MDRRPEPGPPRPLKSKAGPPLLVIIIIVSLVGLLCAKRGDGQPAGDGLLDRFAALPADSIDARDAVIMEDPAAFTAVFDSVLAAGGPDAAARRPFLEEVAVWYFDLYGDSLLVWDAGFMAGCPDSLRDGWYRAVRDDAEGMALRGAGDHAGSAAAFLAAAEGYRRAGHLRREAVAWGSLGVARWYAGDLDGVLAAYDEALDARRRLGDPLLIGRTLNGLGSANLQLGHYEEALAWYVQAREVRERIGNVVDLGTTITYIANVHYQLGRLEEARAGYLEALAVMGDEATPRALFQARNGLANVHASFGEYDAALALYRSELARAEEAGDTRSALLARSNAARVMGARGDHAGALRELEAVRAAHEADGNLYDLAGDLVAIGSSYQSLENLPRALESFREAETCAVESQNESARADALGHRGFVYVKMGLFERAEEDFAAARDIYEALGDSYGVRTALEWAADAKGDRGAGDPEAALTLRRQALALDEENGWRMSAARAHTNIGVELAALGRLDEARAELERAVALAEELGYEEARWYAYLNLADTYEQAGDLENARVYNDLAIGVMEASRGGSLSEETKAAFLDRRAYIYEAQVNVLAQLHEETGEAAFAEEAFRTVERGKARALLDLLEQGRVDVTAGLDPALTDERDRLDRAVSEARYQLRMTEGTDVPADSLRTLKRRLRGLEREYASLTERLRQANPRLATLDAGQPRSVAEIRRVLLPEPGSVLIQYALGDSASHVWALTPDALTLHRMPPRARIEAAVHALRTQLMNPAAGAAWMEPSAALAALLLGPVRETLAAADRITIVPDGALHFLPFEVLLEEAPSAAPDGSAASAPSFVFADQEIHYGPSATTLVVIASGRERGGEVGMELLAVGDPRFATDQTEEPASADSSGLRAGLAALPYTREEVEAIGSLFDPSRTTLLLGEDACESTLLAPDYLSRYRRLHFATHGLVNERRPERSSLALSVPRDPSEDGYLEAVEIYRLRLNAELVVLSACETGMGRMVRGEGVLGLPRAFFYAGAPEVVVSLWSVSDRSTAELMKEFYRRLADGKPTGKALSLAKQALREKEAFNHPFYWAPFVLMGASQS